MTVRTSGPISLLDLQNEFGGSNPISLSEYYRGNGLVNAAVAASGSAFITAPKGSGSGVQIPTGGIVQFSEFYGANAVTYPASGTVLQSNVCSGTTLGNIVADGNGGSYFSATQYNSPTCGYVAPTSAYTTDGSGYAQSSQTVESSMSVQVSVTPSGGNGSYTYQWSFVTNPGATYTLLNPTSQYLNISHKLPKLSSGETQINVNCVVSSAGTSTTVTATATFTWDPPS